MVLALNKEGWATSAGSEESLRTFPQMSPSHVPESQIFLTRALTLVKQTCLGWIFNWLWKPEVLTIDSSAWSAAPRASPPPTCSCTIKEALCLPHLTFSCLLLLQRFLIFLYSVSGSITAFSITSLWTPFPQRLWDSWSVPASSAFLPGHTVFPFTTRESFLNWSVVDMWYYIGFRYST